MREFTLPCKFKGLQCCHYYLYGYKSTRAHKCIRRCYLRFRRHHSGWNKVQSQSSSYTEDTEFRAAQTKTPEPERVWVHFADGFLLGAQETCLALFCQRELVSSHVQKQSRCWVEGGLSFMAEIIQYAPLDYRMIRAPSRGRLSLQQAHLCLLSSVLDSLCSFVPVVITQISPGPGIWLDGSCRLGLDTATTDNRIQSQQVQN